MTSFIFKSFFLKINNDHYNIIDFKILLKKKPNQSRSINKNQGLASSRLIRTHTDSVQSKEDLIGNAVSRKKEIFPI